MSESNSNSAESSREGSPQPDVEMASASQEKPSYAGLLKKVQALKDTVERLKQSMGMKDAKIQGKPVNVMLAELLKEEEELNLTVEQLKMSMEQAGKEVREKEEEVRKLTKKVSRMREGDQQRKPVILTAGANDGRRTAVAILPEELWRMILGNLSDSKELWNCTNTCQLFETILRPWKTGWMFEQALPHLYRHLPGSKLLECRQVSKGWNAGLNRFLENHPSIQPHRAESDPRVLDFVYPVKEKGIGNRNVFTFGPDEDLSVLEQLFPKKLGRNPFIGRYVIFNLRDPDDLEDNLEVEEQRWAKMYSFLESYGKEIWSLSLYFSFFPGPQAIERTIELITSKLFPLAPNLRKLFIGDTTGVEMDIHIDPAVLPPAPNLKTLQGGQAGGEDGIVNALIQRYHLQLEELHVDETLWEFHVDDLDLLNLKELVLYLGLGHDEDDIDIDLRTLSGTRMPQLSRLTLNLEDFDGHSLVRLMGAINELTVTTSLNTLRLVGSFEHIEFGEPATNSLALGSSVKTLELINPWIGESNSLPSHNFLRAFPLIENLNIIVKKDAWLPAEIKYEPEIDLMPDEECHRRATRVRRAMGEVVQFNKSTCMAQMYKSDIWELLPRLKVLTFQWDVYTRENYEAYAKHRASSTSATCGEGSLE